MTLDQAKERARANADYFGVPFYVVDTTLGMRVERDKPPPEYEWRIWFTAQPVVKRCNKCHRPMLGTTAYDGACECGGLIEEVK